MNGFHMRTKVAIDHKKCLLLYRSNEVSESVKTSVRGKMALKTRKRLIFTWSARKLFTEAITERGLHPPMLLSAIGVWDNLGWLALRRLQSSALAESF